MIAEKVFFGAILMAIVSILFIVQKPMQRYLQKWLLASLVTPFLVVISQSSLGGLVMLLWPGSIVLLGIGSGEPAWSDVLHAWGGAITLNLALYFLLGIACYYTFYNDTESK